MAGIFVPALAVAPNKNGGTASAGTKNGGTASAGYIRHPRPIKSSFLKLNLLNLRETSRQAY